MVIGHFQVDIQKLCNATTALTSHHTDRLLPCLQMLDDPQIPP